MGGGLLFSFFDGLLDYRKGHKLFLFNIISTSLNQFLVIDNFKDSQSFLWSLHNDQRRCSCRFTFVQVFATYLIIKLRVLTLWKTVINLHIILNKRQQPTQQELWQKNWQKHTQKPLSPTVTLNNKRITILPPDQIQICFCLIKKA